jgi:hypothetical protein
MIEEKLFELDVNRDGLEVVRRGDRFFVRYDAGSQIPVWREDEIDEADAQRIARGRAGENQVIVDLQRRLGPQAYLSNWTGP